MKSLKNKISIKKYAFIIGLLPALIPFNSYYLGQRFEHINLFAWQGVFVMYGLISLLDFFMGKDSLNIPKEDELAISNELFYRVITLLALPLYLLVLFWSAYVYSSNSFNILGKIGWILSVGTIGGIIAINIAHELIHKPSKTEQIAGGILLAAVSYGGFKVEHVRGHHLTVSTPEDFSSAKYNQSLYHFLPRAWYHNTRNAFILERKRLIKQNKSFFSIYNELLWWYLISAFFAGSLFYLFSFNGLFFFFAQSFVAFTLLEIINYVEHYGLERRKKSDGKYEQVTHLHSWNSNFLLTNLFLFHLQRHSDHHAFAFRRYQILRHFEDSPQLPLGYSSMVLIAIIPPLWFKLMNKAVDAYYANDLLSSKSV